TNGLSKVSDNDLRELLRAHHRGELPSPVTRIGLAQTGLLRLGDELDVLHGLDAAGVRAVLVAVLCERRAKR
ncbi:MAG: hypothetical protein ACI8PZ_007375, partial [Myxococcota bacterium]